MIYTSSSVLTVLSDPCGLTWKIINNSNHLQKLKIKKKLEKVRKLEKEV